VSVADVPAQTVVVLSVIAGAALTVTFVVAVFTHPTADVPVTV
jgi:hypothetical protein